MNPFIQHHLNILCTNVIFCIVLTHSSMDSWKGVLLQTIGSHYSSFLLANASVCLPACWSLWKANEYDKMSCHDKYCFVELETMVSVGLKTTSATSGMSTTQVPV